ncbi:hypothetical protein F5Y01DRAFT_329793 [Xylaria sp. FL0043]|nr:hypothetical protein F5Y01DRAFT_329793 [Xylaria sp. FL0043]
MVSAKTLAIVGLTASPVLAGTPQGYGYGGMTDSLVSSLTDSPESEPSAIMPVTVTDSVTLTKPVTITHTQTVTESQPECGGETTTISSTTRTTLTAKNTITISVVPTPKTPIPVSPSVSEESSSSVTSSVPTASTTGFFSNNTTTSCESDITTGDVDGVTASLSTSSADTITVPVTLSQGTSSTTTSGTAMSTGIAATHTSTSTVSYTTIPTAMGIRGEADAWLLGGALGLVSLVFTFTL